MRQDEALGQRQGILARGGRGPRQRLPASLLQAVTKVITAGWHRLAHRHHLLAMAIADLPALLDSQLRLATLLLRQGFQLAGLPVEAAIDPQPLIGGAGVACAQLIGDFGEAIPQLAARFAAQPVVLPVGGVVGQRRGGEQAGGCQ
ncbi:hypothetical protein D3C79_814160 [compost metagenome]